MTGAARRAPAGDPRVVVREAEPADAARLAELLADLALSVREDPSDPAPYAAALADIARTPGNQILVAELDGAVVGTCQLVVFRHVQHRGGWCAEIESVQVDGALRGRGIGTALLAEAVERARRAGCYRVQLTSDLARVEARRWYERLGFRPTHAGFKLDLAEGGALPGR